MRLLAPLLAAVLTAPVAAQQQTPQFRVGTDLVAIDFLAYGKDGRPIADLKPSDLVLKVDGKTREIKALQFVKLAATGGSASAAGPAPFGANDADSPGRTVIIVVDHEQIRPGEGKAAFDAAGRFLDRLAPADRVGVVTLPNGKVEQDLTTNHPRVRAALSAITGKAFRRNAFWNISLDEALTVERERIDPDKARTQELVNRECRFAPDDSSCRQLVVQEALLIARDTEIATRASLAALAGFFGGLADLDGPKAVVLLSGSIVRFTATHLDMEDVARAAAAARVQLFVIQPNEPRLDATARNEPTTSTVDSARRLEGLEDLAGATGGELLRLSGLGDTAFRRIADLISAHYLLGFEPRTGEQNGKPHTMEITTKRPGVTLRVRPAFVVDDPLRAPPPALVPETLLRTFATHRDLPLRALAYAFRDSDPRYVRIVVAVELPEPAATLTAAAFALVDATGQKAAEWREEGVDVIRRPLVTAAAVPPGEYRLRVAAADTTGRRGTVDYEFQAGLTDAGAMKLGALMLGYPDAGAFRPRLQFDAAAAEATAYVEFYVTTEPGTTLSASFEVASGPGGAASTPIDAKILSSADPDRRVATAVLPIGRLAPGDYVVRAAFTMNGKAVGVVSRTLRKR